MYDQNKGRNFFWKYYRDKIKEYKQDERKKGFKPYFFKNQKNSYQQSYPIKNGTKMNESIGKGTRQQVKFLGREGNHMYKYCPQTRNIMRNV